MGCDIHLHQEVKVSGKWEHYGCPSIDRSYDLFGKMAGVRGDGPPVAPVRGLPKDITDITRMSAVMYGSDGHTHSWLNADEIAELEKWLEERQGSRFNRPFGYLFGNGWGDFKESPGDYPQEIEDIRFVFWFDC